MHNNIAYASVSFAISVFWSAVSVFSSPSESSESVLNLNLLAVGRILGGGEEPLTFDPVACPITCSSEKSYKSGQREFIKRGTKGTIIYSTAYCSSPA